MPERHASSAESTERRVSVLLPLPLAGAYDYSVPHELNVSAGDFVAVPLGKRQLAGVVWGEALGAPSQIIGSNAITRMKAPPIVENAIG